MTDTWRIVAMHAGSGTISHPVIAVAPGCPTQRHPTRDCRCRVFRTRMAAQEYVADQPDGDRIEVQA